MNNRAFRREFEPHELQRFINICSASGLIHYAPISPDKQAGPVITEKYRDPVYREYARTLRIRRRIE